MSKPDVMDGGDKISKRMRFSDGRKDGAKSNIDEASPVLAAFKKYAAQLDKKHDRHEKLVKISRDITIESKKIIFLLHSIDRGREQEQVMKEAKKRLDTLVENSFFNIAKELQSEDPYMYHRAFTYGLQEFIEAYTFYHQLKDKTLNHWDVYQNMFKFPFKSSRNEETIAETELEGIQSEELLYVILPPLDYFLGVADLTGELMRKCINNLGSGDINACIETCRVIQTLYAGFLSIGSKKLRYISEKMFTVKQNVLKVEKVCYTISVRSKEFPEHVAIGLIGDFDGPDKVF